MWRRCEGREKLGQEGGELRVWIENFPGQPKSAGAASKLMTAGAAIVA